MSHLLNRLYTLSARSESSLDEPAQLRIAEYALNNKKQEILELLFIRKDLSPDLGKVILNHGSQEYIALWVSLAKPSKGIILEVIEAMKSSKALNVLASTPNLGSKIYRKILSKSESRSVLLSLISNRSVPLEMVIEALESLLSRYPKEYAALNYNFLSLTPFFDDSLSKRALEFKKLLLTRDEFAHILLKFSDGLGLKNDEVEVASRNVEKFSKSQSLQNILNRINGTDALKIFLEELILDVLEFSESHFISKTSKESLLRGLEGFEFSLKGLDLESNLSKSIRNIKKSVSNYKETELLNLLSECSSRADLDRLAKKCINLHLNDKISPFVKDKVLFTLAESAFCDKDLLKFIFTNIDYIDDASISSITDPELLGLVLAFSDKELPLSIIDESSNPEICFTAYFTTYLEVNNYLPSEVYRSKHLRIEHLLDIDTETLSLSSMEPEAEQSIINYINSELTTGEQWEHLATLGDSFQGSIGDLVKVAKKL